jgi:hypothetical protein
VHQVGFIYIILLYNIHKMKYIRYIIYNIYCIIVYLTSNGLSPGGSGYYACTVNVIRRSKKFNLEGLHEKHAVATWSIGNHLSIRF